MWNKYVAVVSAMMLLGFYLGGLIVGNVWGALGGMTIMAVCWMPVLITAYVGREDGDA